MSRAFKAGLMVLGIVASAVFWPAPRVDISPLFGQHGRQDRPAHPRSIYLPPGR